MRQRRTVWIVTRLVLYLQLGVLSAAPRVCAELQLGSVAAPGLTSPVHKKKKETRPYTAVCVFYTPYFGILKHKVH